MPDRYDIDDAIHSIASIEHYREALESITRPLLENMIHAIVGANISSRDSQEKMIMDKARYEGAKQAIESILDSLGKVVDKNGKK